LREGCRIAEENFLKIAD